ncbi:MAG: hypothetical protein ACLQVN_19270, partial [Bryobacteraceae bacterium]
RRREKTPAAVFSCPGLKKTADKIRPEAAKNIAAGTRMKKPKDLSVFVVVQRRLKSEFFTAP